MGRLSELRKATSRVIKLALVRFAVKSSDQLRLRGSTLYPRKNLHEPDITYIEATAAG